MLVWVTPVRAALDPLLKQPYRLQIVLEIADNRFLTPLFQDQVQRELAAQLKLNFGNLIEVQVVRQHPLLAAIHERGLDQALAGWEDLGGIKTHFVRIDLVAGRYELQARQYDGVSGLASPVVRQGSTTDRSLVAATAVRLIEHDFGLTGTVLKVGKEVDVALQGGQLGVPLGRWLHAGDVLLISKIVQEGDKRRAQPVPWALLEVLDTGKDGICRCRYWHRFQEDRLQDEPGVLGYRCLQIATTQESLRLRLVEDEKGTPLDAIHVQVQHPRKLKKIDASTDRDGLVVTRDKLAHFALVKVFFGEQVRAQFPVPLVDDGPVICRLKLGGDTEGQTAWELRKDQWVRRLYESLQLASERVAQLNVLLTGQSLEAALDYARVGLKNMDEDLTNLTFERTELVRLASAKKLPQGRPALKEGEQRLGELQHGKKELEEFIARLESVVKEAGGDKALSLHKMLESARLFEAHADFDQAIALYEKVLQASPQQGKVRAHLKQLVDSWQPKDPQHVQARAFLFGTWPNLDATDLKAHLSKAQAAFAICKNSSDRLTPLKVLQANIAHAAKLKKRLETLRRQDSDDSRALAKLIADTADGLRQFHAEVQEFLGKSK